MVRKILFSFLMNPKTEKKIKTKAKIKEPNFHKRIV